MIYRNAAHSNQTGSATLKFAGTLVVLGILGFIGFRLVPIYVRENALKRDLQDLSRRAAFSTERVTDAEIKAIIERKRQEYGLPDDTSVDLERRGKTVTIKVSCDIPVDLAVTTYTYPFKAEASESSF